MLLSQLYLPTTKFSWSKNILDPAAVEFAYYSNENCLGWITPHKNYVYSYASGTIEELKGIQDSTGSQTAAIQAKAYLQTLYQTYLGY